jgi:hypothetical protein
VAPLSPPMEVHGATVGEGLTYLIGSVHDSL